MSDEEQLNGFSVGTRVTYDDEDPANPEITGVIVEPTAEEIAYAATYSDPVGPDAGDVLVDWDDEPKPSRAWTRPGDLIRLPENTCLTQP